MATATGSTYFLDKDNVAKNNGLTAAGVLLLILIFLLMIVMALLITKRRGPTVVKQVMVPNNKALAIPRQGFGLSFKSGSSSMSSTAVLAKLRYAIRIVDLCTYTSRKPKSG